MEKETYKNSFHLNDLELARAAEALNQGHYDGFDTKLKNHLEECEACSTHLMELMDVLTSTENVEPKTQIPVLAEQKTSKTKTWLVAASIAALLSFTWAWYNQVRFSSIEHDFQGLSSFSDSLAALEERTRLQQTKLSQSTDQKSDSIQALKEELLNTEEIIASLYLPNTTLEEEMLLVLRSGSLNLIYPNKARFFRSDKLLLQWNSGPEKLNLVIYNNQAVTLKTIKAIPNGYQLPLSDFNYGTYYFELFSGRDLMTLKKFEIYPES
jgi:hypothetical protein